MSRPTTFEELFRGFTGADPFSGPTRAARPSTHDFKPAPGGPIKRCSRCGAVRFKAAPENDACRGREAA